MKYKGIVISDIHVGAMDINKLYKEYSELFIDYIKETDIDFVIVCGDFFDHKFYLNDKEASMAYIMLKDLVNICKEKDIVLRFVYGTESHECNQYEVFSLFKLYDKVDIIKYVKDEELLPELNVLYLPEEYLENKDEYYKDYFSNTNKYDYIFGHGVITEVTKDLATKISNNTSNNKRKKVPLFKTNELSKICKGQTYFGHYHLNEELDDTFFSIGSFSRWKFGEEGRKGFYLIECDTKKNKYNQTYIENTMADLYKTVSIGYNNELFKDSLTDSIKGIEKLIESDLYNHMRFVINVPKDIEDPESTINFIKEKLKNKETVKIDITNGYIEEKNKLKKEKVDEEAKKYSFIFDKSLPLENKINQFISITYNKDIVVDNISKYLYKELNEILTR